MTVELQISKLDAARRQLDVAVRLYFREDDPVSIHTLACAALELLSGLNRVRGGGPLLKDVVLKSVRPERLAEARRAVNAPGNFFKHADRDPLSVIVFKPSQTEWFLYDACLKYKELAADVVPTLASYQLWFVLGPGSEFIDPKKVAVIQSLRGTFPSLVRTSFLQEAVPLVSSLKE